jgi:hypothetical protein
MTLCRYLTIMFSILIEFWSASEFGLIDWKVAAHSGSMMRATCIADLPLIWCLRPPHVLLGRMLSSFVRCDVPYMKIIAFQQRLIG